MPYLTQNQLRRLKLRIVVVAVTIVALLAACLDAPTQAATKSPSPATPVTQGQQPPVATAVVQPKPDTATSTTRIPFQPAPQTSGEEKAFMAQLDAMLAPLLAYSPPDEDLPRIKQAIDANAAGNYVKSRELEAQITDPVGRKLVQWSYFRADGLPASAKEIDAFRRQNPDWPEQATLRLRAEEALLTKTTDAAAILAFFDRDPPQTAAGLAAQAAAYLATGEKNKARALAQKAWREYDFSARTEDYLIGGFSQILTIEDHKYRLDRLLMKDFRYPKERAERVAIVKRGLRFLPEAEQKKINARIAVYSRDKAARDAIIALPGDAINDWGVYFSVIQLARRAGSDAEADTEGQPPDPAKSKEAWKLLLEASTDPAKIVSPDEWFIERRASAYDALKAGQNKTAYDLVANHGPLSANPMKSAEFMAGWIALKYLEDPVRAKKHFTALQAVADGPISKAAAGYWLGRIAQRQGDQKTAAGHFADASSYFDTFYGQLARQTLAPKATLMRILPPALPTVAEQARFLNADAVKGIIVARRAGVEPLVRTFLAGLRYRLTAQGEMVLIAHLSGALGDTQAALRAGKAAILKGYNLVYYAYPTTAFPAYQPLRDPPEPAFLMGVARQESEFDTLTLSGAGAKGVLQVMTVTAKHVCRTYKVQCNIPKLMSDPSYNAKMASAYIGDRMAEYRRSYVMALAGYNAGPGRVRQWVRDFGDPRSSTIDPVDWIERIPFEETRDYVKKVLSNIQIYRSRLGQEATALNLTADLDRARSNNPQPLSAPVQPENETQPAFGHSQLD